MTRCSVASVCSLPWLNLFKAIQLVCHRSPHGTGIVLWDGAATQCSVTRVPEQPNFECAPEDTHAHAPLAATTLHHSQNTRGVNHICKKPTQSTWCRILTGLSRPLPHTPLCPPHHLNTHSQQPSCMYHMHHHPPPLCGMTATQCIAVIALRVPGTGAWLGARVCALLRCAPAAAVPGRVLEAPRCAGQRTGGPCKRASRCTSRAPRSCWRGA